MPDLKTIRTRYRHKPITFLKLTDPSLRFPKKIAEAFALVWRRQNRKGERASRFIMKGPRGGGKSKLLGALSFTEWILQTRNVVEMGGSLEQAKGVYNYFAAHCYSHEPILNSIPKEPVMHNTKSDKGNYFKAIAASPKQTRGPHPDDLYIDEACEAKDEIILSALPMINTSPDPCIVMTSTFHKIFGFFQEVWDHAEEWGYVRISWDIFDVTQVFDPVIWDDPVLNEEIEDLQQLRKRAKGRIGEPEGWIPIRNIIQAWREKSTMDWFDVEYMGSRPSAAGMVNDPEDVDACVISSLEAMGMTYVPGAKVSAGLDWGFSGMTAFTEYMEWKDGIKVEIHNKTYTQTRSEIIIKDIVKEVKEKKIRFIYADDEAKFENADLQNALNKEFSRSDHSCKVIAIPFVKWKTIMLGNYRAHFQRRKLRIPKAHSVAIWQHKRYQYVEGTDKPKKKDDHIPDATMLALHNWPLQKVVSHLPKSNLDQQKQTTYAKTLTGDLLDEQF